MNMNGMLPFPGEGGKPPPLLFSHPDSISILPLLNGLNKEPEQQEKKQVVYSADTILALKERF